MNRRTRASTLSLGLALAGASVALGACSGTPAGATTPAHHSHSSTTSKSTTSSSVTTTTVKPPPAKYVTIGGKRIKVPTEKSGFPIQPVHDTGLQVIIEQHAMVPKTLFAPKGWIVFTNLTNRPQELKFTDYPSSAHPLKSGQIPPGGKFRVKVDSVVSIGYAGSNGAIGDLVVAQLPPTT